MSDTSVIFNILAKDNASSVFGKVGQAMSSMLMGAGFAVGNAALNQLSGAFDFAKDAIFGFNATLQNSQIAFTTMLGSGAKAQAFLADLQAFAKKTPFEFEGLVRYAQNMMGMGIAAKDVIPTLTALGDSVASIGGSAAQVDQVTLAFDQMAAKGTLDMGNMNQLLEGGVPNALRILADAYNVTTGQMIQMISTGKVQSADALPKLIAGLEHGTKSVQGLGGMMDKQSQTFTGALSNIKDGLQQAIAGAFRPFFDVASSGAQLLGNFFSGSTFSAFGAKVSAGIGQAFTAVKGFNFSPLIRAFNSVRDVVTKDLVPAGRSIATTFGPLVKSAFSMAYGAVGPLFGVLKPLGATVKDVFGFMAAHKTTFQALAVGIGAVVLGMKAWTLATALWSTAGKIAAAVQAAFNVVMAMNPIGLIVLAIVGLVAAFAYLWTHSAAFRNFWIGLWHGIWGVLKAVGAWFAGPFVNFFVAAGKAIAAPFVATWNLLKAVGSWFAGPFVNFFVAAGRAIAAPFLWLWHNVLDPAWTAWKTGFLFVMNIVSSFEHLWLWVWQNTIGRVLLWVWHSVFEPVVNGIASGLQWLWGNVIAPVVHAINAAWHAVGDAAVWLWNTVSGVVVHGISAALNWLWGNVIAPVAGAIRAAWNGVGAAAMWLWHNAIEPAMHGVGSALQWVWRSIISPVFNAIKSAVSAVGNAVRSTFSAVGGWISNAFSKAAGIVRGAMNAVIGVINGAIRGINSVIGLANKVPGVNFPSLPSIPRLASGGTLATGGLVQVGERGKEIVFLPAGATVYPHGTAPSGGGPLELRITGSGGLWIALREAVRGGDVTLLDSAGQKVRVA